MKKRLIVSVSIINIVFLLAIGTSCFAAKKKPVVPATVKGATVVTGPQVKSAMAHGAIVFDSRPPRWYSRGRIPGAVLLFYHEKSQRNAHFNASKDKLDMSKLPKDKSKKIVFYCNGTTCWKSYKSVVRAVKAGYTNVLWYRRGLPDWEAHGYPVK